jgi:hypothetical protein
VIEDATPSREEFDVRRLVERSDDSLFGSVVARQGFPPSAALRGLDPRQPLPR